MSDDERFDAIEETLMRLQSELEQLDEAVRAQTRAHDALAQRVDQLERRLTHLEPDEEASGEDRTTDEHG